MFVHLPEPEAAVDQLIAEGRYNDALANMVVAVHNSHKTPELSHHYLYYPAFDRQLQQLAQVLDNGLDAPVGQRRNTLIIATQLHDVGGHSRVVADVVREAESPIIVLTDMYWMYRNAPDQLDWVRENYSRAPVIMLPQRSLWAKCQGLHALTQRLAPRAILYFQHHPDPIPFIGTWADRGARKTLVHHCDHNPSLGNTLPGVHHVDFTDELAHTCARLLERDTKRLPLYVPDDGRKTFNPSQANAFSVVTSGTSIKFAREGELALKAIAHTVLAHTQGQFFFIGPLETEWVVEVQAHLAHAGLDPARFVPLGAVASLWQSLRELDAHLYLGSAPVGGGRAAIEAQGCGYPVAYFRISDPGSALTVDSLYAHKGLGWSDLAELSALLTSVGLHLPALSDAARALYDQRFSRAEFVRVLGEITNNPAS